MKIIGANVTGSFILNSQDVTTTIQTSNVWSGSVATDITALNASTASLNAATASLLNYTSSNNAAISDILLETASFNAFSSSILNYTASTTTAIADILLETASFNVFSASILNYTASTNGAISDILLETASINTFTSSIGGRVSIIEGKYATTGSNTFFGTQTITGSLFISQNLVVQGSSSIQNITASAVSIGTNTIILNTDTPAIRFGGIKVQDSGSGAGASGSLLWDSFEDRWIYVHPSGSTEGYNSAALIAGPKNTGSLGDEAYLTQGRITLNTGEDHIGDSIMTQTGTTISVAGNLTATSLTGSINGSQLTNSTVANAALTNSTISGIALGSNLATLTIGTGLSGTSYNGSGAVTIANTGVTSNVAGTGITVSGATGAVTITNSGVTSIVAGTNISISGGTGAVTITNGVTNNNQLTNGAGYITSAGTAASANSVPWTGVSAGIRENYDLQFRPADNSSSYSGFSFASPGNSQNAGYLLVRGGADSDVYTQNGITIVADLGWLTLAQRSTSSKGVRIMTGTSPSTTRMDISTAGLLSVYGTSYASTQTSFSPSLHIRGAYYGGPRLQVYGLDADANGWMGLGTDMAAGAYQFSLYYPDVAGSSISFGRFNGGNGTRFSGHTTTALLSYAGTFTAAGDIVAYGSPSDISLKTNIKPLENSLDKIIKLQGVSFTWKENTDASKLTEIKDDLGFIAQEVEKVLPELVRKNKDNGLLSLRDKGIMPLLVEAIKEQQIQIEELKTIINGLTK